MTSSVRVRAGDLATVQRIWNISSINAALASKNRWPDAANIDYETVHHLRKLAERSPYLFLAKFLMSAAVARRVEKNKHQPVGHMLLSRKILAQDVRMVRASFKDSQGPAGAEIAAGADLLVEESDDDEGSDDEPELDSDEEFDDEVESDDVEDSDDAEDSDNEEDSEYEEEATDDNKVRQEDSDKMEVQQTDNLDKDSARQASHTVEPSTSRQEHVDWFELAAQGSVALTELAKGFINLHEQLCKDYSKIKILALKEYRGPNREQLESDLEDTQERAKQEINEKIDILNSNGLATLGANESGSSGAAD